MVLFFGKKQEVKVYSILQSIEDWFRGLLVSGIMDLLEMDI